MKKAQLQEFQKHRKVMIASMAVCFAAMVVVVCDGWVHSAPLLHEFIETAGMLFIFVAIIGRTWCAIHISGNKGKILVREGPYSLVRNPLYFFSLVGAAGVGAQTGSLTLVAVAMACIAFALHWVTLKEEHFLRNKFGDLYRNYCAHTPRYIPSLSGFSTPSRICFDTKIAGRSFMETSAFLLAVPAIEGVELARSYGLLPEILHLP